MDRNSNRTNNSLIPFSIIKTNEHTTTARARFMFDRRDDAGNAPRQNKIE